MNAIQSKTWDFTVNNYSDADKQLLESWSNEVTRGIASTEVGDSGTPHIQGRVTFKRTYRASALKKMAPTWHWEKTMCAQDYLYPMKAGSVLFWNVDNRKQGKRSDLEAACAIIKEDPKNWRKRVWEEHPEVYAKFHRGLNEGYAVQQSFDHADEPRYFEPEVHVRWGEPRTGKTRYVYDNHPLHEIWVKPNTDRFCGYRGQPVALFDDFYGGIQYGEMLKLLDRYPYYVDQKYGGAQWRPRIIYITSNAHPNDWYKNIADKRALFGRFTSITKVGDENYEGHEYVEKI